MSKVARVQRAGRSTGNPAFAIRGWSGPEPARPVVDADDDVHVAELWDW